MFHALLMFLFTLQEHYLLQALAGIHLVLYFIRLVLLDSGSAKTAPCCSGCVNSYAYESVPEINCQRKSPKDSARFTCGLGRFTQGLRQVYARFTPGLRRFAHGLRMVYAGLRMVCEWFTHGLHGFAHGLRMVCAWFAHGLRMVCAWFAQVCAWFAQSEQGMRMVYALANICRY